MFLPVNLGGIFLNVLTSKEPPYFLRLWLGLDGLEGMVTTLLGLRGEKLTVLCGRLDECITAYYKIARKFWQFSADGGLAAQY